MCIVQNLCNIQFTADHVANAWRIDVILQPISDISLWPLPLTYNYVRKWFAEIIMKSYCSSQSGINTGVFLINKGTVYKFLLSEHLGMHNWFSVIFQRITCDW